MHPIRLVRALPRALLALPLALSALALPAVGVTAAAPRAAPPPGVEQALGRARLVLLPPGPAAPHGTLALAGGPAGGTAVLVLEGAPGAVLARLPLDATGSFRLALDGAALRSGAVVRAWVRTARGGLARTPPFVLPGTGTSAAVARQTGEIVVTEFMKDPTVVSDTRGEWIELYNTTAAVVDVEGWVLSDDGSDVAVLDNQGLGIAIAPGGYLVLGREPDPSLNGGVFIDIAYAGMTLSNGEDEIVLSRPSGVVVDSVRYDDGVRWPDEAGRSIGLCPLSIHALRNDAGERWCHSSLPIAGGPDTGTPGQVNESCP